MALIEPSSAAPAVEIEPTEPQAAEAPPADQGAELPDELLRLPSMGPLLAGSPSAMSIKIADMAKTDEGKIVAANAKPLQDANIFFYRALDKSTGVIANGLYVTPEQIQQADAQNQLASVAPAWNMVGQEASRNASINPVLNAQTPAGPPTAPAPAPPQVSSGTMLPPPPASAQKSLAGARARNLQPGSPTSGPAPGRGRILSNILKPAI